MNIFERLNYDLIDVEKYFRAKGKRQFDYIGSKGPWVSNQLFSEMERFKFYLKLNRQSKVYLKPLRWIARRRVQKMYFGFTIIAMIHKYLFYLNFLNRRTASSACRK